MKVFFTVPGWRSMLPTAARLLTGGLALLPLYAFLSPGIPAWNKALLFAVVAGASLNPGTTLLACSAVIPVAAPLAGWLGSPLPLTEPLVLAFLAGWLFGDSVRRPAPAVGRGWRGALTPAALLAVTIAASVIVQILVRRVYVDFGVTYLDRVVRFIATDYFRTPTVFPLAPGFRVLEGLGLFVAVLTLARRQPALRLRSVLALCAVGAAAAGALNAYYFVTTIGPTGGWLSALFANVVSPTARISRAFPDPNAAGSYFAMALCVAIGLAWGSRRPIAWLFPTGLIVLGLWLAGSRTALVALPIAGSIMVLPLARRYGWAGAKVLAGGCAVLLLLAVVYWSVSAAAPERSTALAMDSRVEMGAAAVRMFEDHPFFGAGVGRFFDLSIDYISPRWKTIVQRENAHNNFLQVLAELGVTGFVFFLWLVLAVLAPALTWSAGRASAEVVGTCTGVMAFLLTCLAGHPLLIFEVSLVFWLVLAGLAGLTSDLGPPPSRARAWVWGLAAVALLASAPLRAERELARADLTGAGRPLSNPRVDTEGVRFRWMLRRATVYVPGNATLVAVPLKLPGGVADIAIFLGERPAARLVVDAARWRDGMVALPGNARARFVPVEIRLESVHQPAEAEGGDAPGTDRVMVGVPRVLEWARQD